MKDDLPPLPNFIETDLCAAMQEWAETEPGDDAEAAFALVVKWFGIELQAYAKAHNAKLEAQVERMRLALQPFVGATLTDHGHIIGLMRENFERAVAAALKL